MISRKRKLWGKDTRPERRVMVVNLIRAARHKKIGQKKFPLNFLDYENDSTSGVQLMRRDCRDCEDRLNMEYCVTGKCPMPSAIPSLPCGIHDSRG
jgi:hypothetical protein